MVKSVFKWALMVSAAQLVFSGAAEAQQLDPLAKERFQIRARIIDVAPQEDSSVNIGGKTNVDNAVVPEVDVTYFVTQKVGLELIAATAKHDIEYNGTTDVGSAWILPPTLTLQYHPMRGESNFSPYIGAGLNYSMFYSEDTDAPFTDLNVDGGVGYALQVGMDYWLNDNWGVNLDAKKLWLNIDGDVNLGATRVTTDIDLDPWILGAGVSYRF